EISSSGKGGARVRYLFGSGRGKRSRRWGFSPPVCPSEGDLSFLPGLQLPDALPIADAMLAKQVRAVLVQVAQNPGLQAGHPVAVRLEDGSVLLADETIGVTATLLIVGINLLGHDAIPLRAFLEAGVLPGLRRHRRKEGQQFLILGLGRQRGR